MEKQIESTIGWRFIHSEQNGIHEASPKDFGGNWMRVKFDDDLSTVNKIHRIVILEANDHQLVYLDYLTMLVNKEQIQCLFTTLQKLQAICGDFNI